MGGNAAAAEAATLSGVSKVLFADDHAYCHGMAESTAGLIVSLADEVLGRNGRMVKAIEKIGRGADAFEGTPFVLRP